MLGVKKPLQEPVRSHDSWIGPAPDIKGPLPGPNAKQLIERDQRVTSPSYTRDYPLVVKRASGSVLEDVDGNRFLDFAAGIAVCSTGHCHPKVTAAIEAQAKSLIHICGCDFYFPGLVDLTEKLTQVVPGDFPKKVFLTNSGTEATECALKLARYHTNRKWIIAFHGAFHGRTMGALSLTCSKFKQRERFGPFVPMTAHVPYGDADAIETQLFKQMMSPSEVAAIFVEPVQGEGGYIIPNAEFLPKLRALCDKHGILLVCDEVQSGCGRTGKWFACEHFGVVPDITLIAKGVASGMPIGAVVARADVMSWPPGAQGSTYGGNPVCCAAALATLEQIETHYLANVVKLGPRLLGTLSEIAERRKTITNVRGLGFMCAVDVTNRRTGKADVKLRTRILESSFERGLVLLPCGDCGIRFCPPLCINEAQLDVGLKVFDEALATVA